MAAKDEAQNALFEQIRVQTEAVGKSSVPAASKATALRNLALAYRYAAGGQQPGGVGGE